MTLEEYYKAKENIKIPEGLSWEDEEIAFSTFPKRFRKSIRRC